LERRGWCDIVANIFVTTKAGDKFLSSYKEITGLILPAGKQHSLVRA
jgi:hypothetical protein